MNLRLTNENKKYISKIILIMSIVNLIIIILSIGFIKTEIIENIILYIISIAFIIEIVLILKNIRNNSDMNFKENDEYKYDPILNNFLVKNEFILDQDLINDEILYLKEKGFIEYIEKEGKKVIKLSEKQKFIQIDALERINDEKIKEYSTEEIPSYESLFIKKILFPFKDEILEQELDENIKNNYYYKRGELCKLIMERMILYELEKKNMLSKSSTKNKFAIFLIINIITNILLFIVLAKFNILLILAVVINLIIKGIMLKNERLLSYNYTEEVNIYIDKLIRKNNN